MMVEALGTLTASAKLQYICTLLHCEALCQFDNLCAQVGSTTTPHISQITLGLGMYFPPVNALSRKRVQCAAEGERREN